MKHPLSRAEIVRKTLSRNKVDAFLVTSIKNVRYLTGFTGSSGFVIVTRDKSFFFTDFRYVEQAGGEVAGFELLTEKGRRTDTLRSFVKKQGILRLGFESSVSYEFYQTLEGLGVTPVPQTGLIEKLRLIKDKEELDNIVTAVRRAEVAFLKVKPWIRPGVTEREAALRLELLLKKAGCKDIPFDIIIASGKHSSMPHAQPTGKKIEKNDFVIIDWGGEAGGYYSDMTRTLLMPGQASPEKLRIYYVVNEARRKAISAVKAGMKCRDVDAVARDFISKEGYGDFFGHGTGHGVGLEVHEAPRVSRTSSERVSEGMVFTVEPGIYVPGLGGVRIEDMVHVKNGKGIIMTTLGRDLETPAKR